MSKLKNKLTVLKKEGTNSRLLVGNTSGFAQMMVLGSSVLLSAREGQWIQHLPIPDVEVGIIALRVNMSSEGPIVDFVEIRQQDDSTFLELDKSWIPSGQRPGLIVGDRFVQVLIGTEYFSSNPNDEKARFVDANVLCAYLYGNVDAIDVKNQAAALEEEKSARERVADLEKQVLELEEILAKKLGETVSVTV